MWWLATVFVNECHLKSIKLLFCIIPSEYMCVWAVVKRWRVFCGQREMALGYVEVCVCFVCVCECVLAAHAVSDVTHHYYESLWLRGFYLSFLQKHPLTVLTECVVVGAVKELLVYLWIQRGVYQSQTDCGTDSIIWPLMLLLMIFLLKMSVSCCSCYFHSCPGNHRWNWCAQVSWHPTWFW